VALIDVIAARAPVQANRTLAYLRKLFNWCVERDLLTVSPMARIGKPNRETDRDRVLGDAELAEIWRASDDLDWPFGPVR
jgi:site-specific recombinase XerD